jgi:hypothetical protein
MMAESDTALTAEGHCLDLSRAGLTELPASIGEMRALRRLYLDDNKLTLWVDRCLGAVLT